MKKNGGILTKKEGEMMKWLHNLEMIANNKGTGLCPYCDSDKTEYGVHIDDKEKMMGHGVVWCNACKHAFLVSRIKIDDERYIKEIPSDLTY